LGPDGDPSSELTADFGDIPVRGLEEVLTSWVLAGKVHRQEALHTALGAVEGAPDVEREWNPEQARERCRRVLWGLLEERIGQLPTDPSVWLNALPAQVRVEQVRSSRPVRPVDWRSTVRTNRGWPGWRGWDGFEFVGRRRHRDHDSVLLSVVNWTVQELVELRSDARHLLDRGTVHEEVFGALEALKALLPAEGRVVELEDIRAVERIGPPWNLLTPLSHELLRLQEDPLLYAHEVVLPDDELRWRLFHLACYGEILALLGDAGLTVASAAPLAGGARRPTHSARIGKTGRIDLWFEASGCWDYYGSSGAISTYQSATKSALSGRQNLSPDCLVVRFDEGTGEPESVVGLECKYSENSNYVVRDGYLQSLGYSIELARLFPVSARVGVWTVGPGSLVTGESHAGVPTTSTSTPPTVGLCEPSALGRAVESCGLLDSPAA